jgi:predicted Zn-dependent protease
MPTSKSQLILAQARSARQDNEIDLAISFYQQFLKKEKHADDVRYELATFYATLKKHKEAIPIYKILLKANGQNPYLNANLGTACIESGLLADGLFYIKKALSIKSSLIELYIPIAECYRRLKKFELAKDSLKYYMSIQPNHHGAYCVLGLVYSDMNEIPKSLECFERSVSLEPNVPEYRMHFAKALIDQGFLQDAKIQIQSVLKIKPDWIEPKYLLIEIMEKNHKFFDALDYLEHLIIQNPDDSKIQEFLCKFYIRVNYMAEAKVQLDALLKKEFNNINIKILEIAFLEKDKQPDRAKELKKELIKLHGNKPLVIEYAIEDQLILDIDPKIIQNQLALTEVSLKYKDKFNFFFGTFYDAHKNWDKAFEYFTLANKIKNQYYQMYEEEYFKNLENRISNLASQCSQDKHMNRVHSNLQVIPIFIVGMSRTGKTWLESLLNRAACVISADEVKLNFYKPLNVLSHNYQANQDLELKELHIVHEEYSSEITRYSKEKNTRYVINTLPENAFFIGYIRQLFPDAPIIFMQRDPMDTVLFNFFKNYGNDMPYAYKLENIARYYLLYKKTMNFWITKFPNKILQFQFENSVNKPLESFEELSAFLNIKQAIDKNSKLELQNKANQYKKSIGYWKNYEKFLGEIKKLKLTI